KQQMAFIGNLNLDSCDVQHRTWLSKKSTTNKKIYNNIRHVTINRRLFFEIKTQLKDVTFLFDIKIYNKYSLYTWTAKKLNNHYNLQVTIKNKNRKNHQKLYKTILEIEGY
ncbi:2980_t:CDS:1, partial [Gigaspora margarita]